MKKLKEKPAVLSFCQALQLMLDGQKLTKLEWGNEEFWGEIKNTYLQLHKPDGTYVNWILNDGDMVGSDYYIIK